MQEAVIVAGVRTAIGRGGGALESKRSWINRIQMRVCF